MLFVAFADELSGKELFCATEVVHLAGTDDSVIPGNSLLEAKAESKRNSGILNAQIRHALDLVQGVSVQAGQPSCRYGVDIAKAIDQLFQLLGFTALFSSGIMKKPKKE